MTLINRTVLIEKTRVELARALAAGMSSGGVGMFETPVYSGAVLAYYISSGRIDAGFGPVLTDANALFIQAGGAATLAQCQDLISSSIVVNCDTEGAYATLARLGLTLGG